MKAVFLVFLGLLAWSGYCEEEDLVGSDPTYDHQTATYDANHRPLTLTNANLKLTAFFSPDHSVDTLTHLVESATTSVDIGIPSWGSWSGCTPFDGGGGCSFEFLRDREAFPIQQALLNAIHRGVRVRILTNNYNTAPETGAAYPLDFLAVAGADVRYYTTTTFYHAKYLMVDGKVASVSSINFSWTSFMKNREAGFLISGTDAAPALDYLTTMFDYDYEQALAWPHQQYNSSDVAIADDKAKIPVVIPPPVDIPNAYVSTVTEMEKKWDEVKLVVGPDYGFYEMTAALNASKSTVNIFIYQITDGGFCEILASLAQSGVTMKLLVSDHIVSQSDYEAAQLCYAQIYNAGATIYKTDPTMYSFSHQKYVLIDSETMLLSTGNMGSTDYPDASVFPPYGQPHWMKVNRDITVKVVDSEMVAAFQKVMDEDISHGGWLWQPRSKQQ